MINRFIKGFMIVSLVFVFGCGGWLQKTKTFVKSPFGEKKEASEKMTEGLKEDPMEKGKNLFMKGDMKMALKEFEAIAKTDTSSPEVHYNLGLTYFELGSYSKAINAYKRAIQLKPDFAEAHFNLGVIYDQSGQMTNALQSYQAALKYGIDDAAIHFNIGLSLLKLSRLEESKKEMLRALELEPDLAEAYNNLGYLDEATGDIDLAIAKYKKALAIKPDYKLARENLERLVKVPPPFSARPPISKKKLLSKLFFELDGKILFTRDLELETTSGIVEISEYYQRALFRLGYNPVDRVDLFLDLGLISLGFDDPIFISSYNVDFKRVLGLAYGAGLNADVYHLKQMNLGFDAGVEYLMGSNEDERKGGAKATADWTELTLFVKTRYLGLNNLVPYGGFTFSKVDGTFELIEASGKTSENDYSESDPFGIFVGGNYYLGEHIRLQTEARFLDETSLTFRVGYSF